MITHSRLAEVRAKLMQRRRAMPRPRLPLSAERLYLGAMRNYAEAIIDAVCAEVGIAKPAARTDAMQKGPIQFGARTHRIIADVRLRVAKNQANIPLDQVGSEVRRLGELDAKRLLGIKNTDMFLGRQVMQWREENTALITNFTEDTLAQMGTILEEYSGYRVEDLADRLEGTFNMTRARAELIARDQTLKLNSNIAEGAQRQVGITQYRWSTSNDESVRESHALLEGETFSWDEPPVVNQVEVDTKGKPERREHPGRDYQCRCVAIPIVEEYETPGETSEGADGRWHVDYDDSQPRDEAGRSRKC